MIFKRKPCFVCKSKFKPKDLYKLHVTVADGRLLLHFCTECARKYLESEEELDDKSI